MINEGVNLLRKLGSGVIPDGSTPAVTDAPLEGSDFPTLLVGASRGEIKTGRAVQIGADLDSPVTFDQLQNLADAADLAEATGVDQVVAFIDRRALALDVRERRITAELPLELAAHAPADVLVGVEAIVVAEPTLDEPINDEDSEVNEVHRVMTTPIAARRFAAELMQIQNRSVAELLAGQSEQSDTRRAG